MFSRPIFVCGFLMIVMAFPPPPHLRLYSDISARKQNSGAPELNALHCRLVGLQHDHGYPTKSLGMEPRAGHLTKIQWKPVFLLIDT